MPSTRSKAKATAQSSGSSLSATRATASTTAKATAMVKSSKSMKTTAAASDQEDPELDQEEEDGDDELAYFEHQRKNNIKRNQSLFSDLVGSGPASAILGSAKTKSSSKRTSSSRRASSDQGSDGDSDSENSAAKQKKASNKKLKKSASAAAPLRRSSRTSLRLRGINPPSEPTSQPATGSLAAAGDDEDGTPLLDQSVLSLADTTHALDRASQLLASLAAQGTVIHDDADVESERSPTSGTTLASQFANLRVHHTPPALKLTPSRIAALAVAPRDDRYLVCAGDKQGTLALSDLTAHVTDPLATQEIQGGIQLKPHADAISALHFTSPLTLVTASYDGTVRVLDVVTQRFMLGARMPRGVHVQALDANPEAPNVVWYSTDAGGLGVLDLRAPPLATGFPHVYQAGVCEKKVGSVSVHPQRRERVLVASNDTHARVYDVRYALGGGAGFETCKERVWYKHAYSCTAAYWKPHDGLGVCTTSYDDLVRVWSGDVVGGAEEEEGQEAAREMKAPTFALRHDNKTGRWVTLFRAKYHPTLDNCLLIGNMQRHMDVIDASIGRVVATLGDPGITAVPAVTGVHPTASKWARVVVGANASGKVSVWTRPGSGDDAREEEGEEEGEEEAKEDWE